MAISITDKYFTKKDSGLSLNMILSRNVKNYASLHTTGGKLAIYTWRKKLWRREKTKTSQLKRPKTVGSSVANSKSLANTSPVVT